MKPLGYKLTTALTKIKEANKAGLSGWFIIEFDAELEVQLTALGFKCKTVKGSKEYLTLIS